MPLATSVAQQIAGARIFDRKDLTRDPEFWEPQSNPLVKSTGGVLP